MPRRIIGEEVAAKALRLHKQGLPYRAIGTALGIDPRTAKDRVQRLAAEEQAGHWQGVAQIVDATYLDEHYQLLQRTGSGVLRAVATHPRSCGPTVNAEALLTYHVGVALIQSKEVLLGRGIVLEPGPEAEVSIPEKVSQSLLEGLKEHEQPLASALDGWVKQWQSFQTARQELIAQGQRLLSQRGYQKDAASRMAEDALQELTQGSNGGMVGSQVFNPSPMTDELKGSDYRWMLEQISNPGRLLDLNQADTRVVEAASLLEREILRLQLRGRPRGECSLCPSRGGT
jgi:hypothetical protein